MSRKSGIKTAIVKTINGEFSIDYSNSRDFVNGIRSAIERKSLYEFTHGNTRVLVNSNNIVSLEMETEALGSAIPIQQMQSVGPQTPEEVRASQIAMQPDIHKFEAKAKAMADMKEKEDAIRKAQFEAIYPVVKN
jgi:hypothetical protein